MGNQQPSFLMRRRFNDYPVAGSRRNPKYHPPEKDEDIVYSDS
nr:MAG TPA: hypothetical protein [Caudoviricetes sp.]